MHSKLLLPPRFKRIGLIVLIPSLVLGIAVSFFDFSFSFHTHLSGEKTQAAINDIIRNFTDEILLTGLIIGLLLVAFSRERREDEFISRIRLESLQWAVITNYILLLIATWAIYDMAYLSVMVYNMLTILILFIIRFHIALYRNRSISTD